MGEAEAASSSQLAMARRAEFGVAIAVRADGIVGAIGAFKP
jgi:hypothetical protein